MTSSAPIPYQLFTPMRDMISGLLFYVSQEKDDSIIIYQAKRVEDELVDEYVIVYQSTLNDPTKKTSGMGIVLNRFFGMNVAKEGKVYTGSLSSLPHRPLRLRLKKQRGRVTATTTMHATWANNHVIDVPDAEIYNVHMVRLPGKARPDKIIVYARALPQDIEIGLQKAGLRIPKWNNRDEMLFITEEINVTSEMMVGVDADSMNDEWMKKQQ
jgi:hypothetical protein